MRKLIAAGTAAALLAGTMATAAEAGPRRHYDRHHDRDNTGAVVAAGIIGLALGAAVASGDNDRRYYGHRYHSRPHYGRAYYGRSHYAPRRYRPTRCTVITRWDPYYGRYMRTQRCR